MIFIIIVIVVSLLIAFIITYELVSLTAKEEKLPKSNYNLLIASWIFRRRLSFHLVHVFGEYGGK
jgi:hypothetical protein